MDEVVEEGQRKGKGRASPFELEDLEGLEAQPLGLSNSMGVAQRAARSRAEGKVRQWETKEGGLRRAGEDERADWARGNLEKA